MNYHEMLGTRQSKKLANNTYLTREGEVLVIRLHGNRIVDILPDGSKLFYSAGWHTATTKKRLNSVASREGYSVIQRRGAWLWQDSKGQRHPFQEGDCIHPTRGLTPRCQP